MANTTSNTRLTRPEPGIPVPLSLLLSMINEWKVESFTHTWDNLEVARQVRNCIPIRPDRTKYILSLSRRNIKRLIDILTGHYSLNNRLHVLGYRDSINFVWKLSVQLTLEPGLNFWGTSSSSMTESVHPSYTWKYFNGTNRF